MNKYDYIQLLGVVLVFAPLAWLVWEWWKTKLAAEKRGQEVLVDMLKAEPRLFSWQAPVDVKALVRKRRRKRRNLAKKRKRQTKRKRK